MLKIVNEIFYYEALPLMLVSPNSSTMVIHMAKVVRDDGSQFHNICIRHCTDAEAEVIVLLHFE